MLAQFLPPLTPAPAIPQSVSLTRGAWVGIEWAMEAHTDAEIAAFAAELVTHQIHDAYLYVSYLRPDDVFNPTYDHASAFTRRIRQHAPDIRLWAWVGVPIHIMREDGSRVNRLDDPLIRQSIANFGAFVITDLGFDGLHLNAELAEEADAGYLETLRLIRQTMPTEALFSVTAHALRLDNWVTLTPYPVIPHHWTAEHLLTVATLVDQIALMAYDSGLPFPADYRRWVAYQVEKSAAILQGSGVELVIGLPTSEEWTPSHQTQAEHLSDGLYGLQAGFSERVTGVALYPYWETSAEEWALIQRSLPLAAK